MQSHPTPPTVAELLAHQDWLRGLALRLVGESAADDLVQETWLAALNSPPDGDRPMRPWLSRVLTNFARKRWRGEGRRLRRETACARSEALPPETEEVERTEVLDSVAVAVHSMEEPYRSTLVSRYYGGESSAAIARREGLPDSTVRWRLMRGLELLSDGLDRKSGGDRDLWKRSLAAALMLPGDKLRSASQSTAGAGASASSLALAATVLIAIGTLGAAAFHISTRATTRAEGLVTPELAFVSPEAIDRTRSETSVAALPQAEVLRKTAKSTQSQAQVQAAGFPVRARLLDLQGSPIAGGVLLIESEDGTRVKGNTGPTGHVEAVWASAPTSDALWMRATAPNCQDQRRQFRFGDQKSIDLGDLVLERGGGLSARLVGHKPDLPVRYVITRGRNRGFNQGRPAKIGGPRGDNTLVEGFVSENGTLNATGLPVGIVRLWARSEESLWAFSGEIEIEVSVLSRVEIELTQADPELRLGGLVLDPEGRPLARACLRVGRDDRAPAYETKPIHWTDDQGRFDFLLANKEPQWVYAWDQKGRFGSVRLRGVQGGALDLVVQLGTQKSVQVLVQDQFGLPVPGAEVQLVDAFQYQKDTDMGADEAGLAVFEQPSGPFYLTVSALGFRTLRRGPLRTEGTTRDHIVNLERSKPWRGRLVEQGKPLKGVTLDFHNQAAGFMVYPDLRLDGQPPFSHLHPRPDFSCRTDEFGEFTVPAPRVGRYWARVHGVDSAPRVIGPIQSTLLETDEPVDLELTLGVTLRGRLHLPKGQDPSQRSVLVCGAFDLPRWTTPDEGGRFEFKGLPPGNLQVRPCPSGVFAETALGSVRPAGQRVRVLWDLEGQPGQVLHFDLDLAPGKPCEAVCELEIENLSTAGWTASLEPLLDGVPAPAESVEVSAEGRFRIEALHPGPYELILRGQNGELIYEVRDRIVLGRLPIVWSRRLRTGSLELYWTREQMDRDLGEGTIAYAWTGPDHFTVLVKQRAVPGVDMVFPILPAGPGQVVSWEPAEGNPTDPAWLVKRGPGIPMGGTLRFSMGANF